MRVTVNVLVCVMKNHRLSPPKLSLGYITKRNTLKFPTLGPKNIHFNFHKFQI